MEQLKRDEHTESVRKFRERELKNAENGKIAFGASAMETSEGTPKGTAYFLFSERINK